MVSLRHNASPSLNGVVGVSPQTPFICLRVLFMFPCWFEIYLSWIYVFVPVDLSKWKTTRGPNLVRHVSLSGRKRLRREVHPPRLWA